MQGGAKQSNAKVAKQRLQSNARGCKAKVAKVAKDGKYKEEIKLVWVCEPS